MKIIGIIAIRSGSVGVKDKNIKKLCGKPLVCHTIDIAIQSNRFDEIIVSTDSIEYINILKKHYYYSYINDSFIKYIHRPAYLATSDAVKSDVLLHVFNELNYSDDTIFVELQVTSPLRTTDLVNDTVDLYLSGNYKSLITVKPFDRNISLVSSISGNGLFNLNNLDAKHTNRQSQGSLYYPDGSIWISKVGYFKQNQSFYTDNTYGYISPDWTQYDIDSELNFKIVECVMGEYIEAGIIK